RAAPGLTQRGEPSTREVGDVLHPRRPLLARQRLRFAGRAYVIQLRERDRRPVPASHRLMVSSAVVVVKLQPPPPWRGVDPPADSTARLPWGFSTFNIAVTSSTDRVCYRGEAGGA